QALKINPRFVDAHNNLGICYFDKGKIDKAISQFQHALRINSNHADAHYNLGVAYGSKGKYDMAFKEMRIARRLNSGQQWKKISGGIKGEKGSVLTHP
ncbi:MAG: tetratricopeptide repeat protein, partial [Deltaproteobacteria bacterium]|nr:tetratricopeptide repeat protein [Deltaproteobacteria bacterium]